MTPQRPKSGRSVAVRGARTHNLKSIDVDLPIGKLSVITGPSGAGKSSLAFDTIYAEAQRRFVESLSIQARQSLELLPRPDVDHIDGLSPAIALEQRALRSSPRATLSTATEIADHLRLLFARIGEVYCPICGDRVRRQSPQQIVDALLASPPSTKMTLLAPVGRGLEGDLRSELDVLRRQGFVRARVDGSIIDLSETERLDRKEFSETRHVLEVVIDRLVAKENADSLRARATDSTELALRVGRGRMRVLREIPGGASSRADTRARQETSLTWHSERFACEKDDFVFPPLEPNLFSFNTPEGACPTCAGLGTLPRGDEANADGRDDEGADLAEEPDAAPDAQSARQGEPRVCDDCGGTRLRIEARSVKLRGASIADVTAMSLPSAAAFLEALLSTSESRLLPVARPLLAPVIARLGFLIDIGLHYLALGRSVSSLSAGERQRMRLATALATGLEGVLYVLDEPTVGLHPKDTARLIEAMHSLCANSSTLVVVEHDLDVIRAADHVVEIGPVAGAAGGFVVAQGSPQRIARTAGSVTAAWLRPSRRASTGAPRKLRDAARVITMRGASLHNLKNIDVEVPLGLLVAVTGVSGSGKSSLIIDTLLPAARLAVGARGRSAPTFAMLRALEGTSAIDSVIAIDQTPLGRSPKSSPATYTGVMAKLRELFAAMPEAKARGYKPGRFSFNVKGGRCETCRGEGMIRVQMAFLPDVFVECSECHGARFNRETLDVRFKGHSIADVLSMSVDDAQRLLEAIPGVRERLDTMRSLGLGYLALGQPATTLSGGEAQRVKLARELARKAAGSTLYVLDEPTTGLHPVDVSVLIDALAALRDQGNTIVVVEHDVELIARADWVIDLGPGAGPDGGEVVEAGPPDALRKSAIVPFLPLAGAKSKRAPARASR